MDLNFSTKTVGAEDQSWLGSAHGTDAPKPVTLDGTLLGAVFTDGRVPSGVVLGKVTATGRYALYDDAAVDGRTAAVGILYTTVFLNDDPTAPGTFHNVQGAMLMHCFVIASKLPRQSGAGSLDANGKTDLAGRVIVL